MINCKIPLTIGQYCDEQSNKTGHTISEKNTIDVIKERIKENIKKRENEAEKPVCSLLLLE